MDNPTCYQFQIVFLQYPDVKGITVFSRLRPNLTKNKTKRNCMQVDDDHDAKHLTSLAKKCPSLKAHSIAKKHS